MIKKIRKKIYRISKKIGDKLGIDLPYFVENGFWAVINQFSDILSGLILSIIFARFLTKDVYGTYQFILSIISIVSIVSIPGLNTSLFRTVAKGMDGDYLSSVKYSIKYSLIGVPILFFVAIYYQFTPENNYSIFIIVSSILFPFLYSFNLWISFIKGKSMFETLAKWRFISLFASTLIISLTSIFFPESALYVLLAYLISTTSFNLLFFIKSKKHIRNNEKSTDTFKYGQFITKMQFLGLIINNFDKIIVGFFDIEVLAVYSIALKMLDLMKGASKSLFSVTFPKFAKQSVSIKNSQIVSLFLFGTFLSVILYFISEFLIVSFFSIKYYESAILFKKLVWVTPLFFSYFFLVQKVSAQKMTKKIRQLQIYPTLLALFGAVSVILITENIELFVISKIYILYLTSFIIVLKK